MKEIEREDILAEEYLHESETEEQGQEEEDLEPEEEDLDEELEVTDDDDDDEPEKHNEFCCMCHRTEKQGAKLVHMPNHMSICTDCMQKSFDSFGSTPGNGGIQFVDLSNMDFNNLKNMNLGDLLAGSLSSQQVKPKKKKKKAKEEKKQLSIQNIPAPHQIKAKLDEYVIGQDYAKKVMAVAVYNHYKRVITNTMNEIEIDKSNMLMIGPTGCGKTHLVKTLARMLNVPLAICDATSLTEAGYIGDDVESVLSKLLANADNDVERAETGIIFIDEIDKIAKKKFLLLCFQVFHGFFVLAAHGGKSLMRCSGVIIRHKNLLKMHGSVDRVDLVLQLFRHKVHDPDVLVVLLALKEDGVDGVVNVRGEFLVILS